MRRLTLVLIIIFAAGLCYGDGPTVQFKGLVQGWFSHAQQDSTEDDGYGFTLRRVRFAPFGTFSKNIKWGMQLAWDKQSPKFLDGWIDFRFSKGFGIKVGQFAAPGTVSGALTSSGALDMVERPAVSQRWNSNSALSGYRAIGVQFHGNLLDGKLYYAFMAANPRTTGLFTPGIKSADYSNDYNGIMFWARAEAKPTKGMRVGAFFGSGKEDDSDYKRSSYGGHLFYVNKVINFKAEYIGGEFGYENMETKYNGFYSLLGYKINKVEPIVRYDSYTPNDGNLDGNGVERYNNITIGLNYYHNKNVKLQVNYVLRDESMAGDLDKLDNNLFYIHCQYSFKSKYK